jgi:hypothetical protein
MIAAEKSERFPVLTIFMASFFIKEQKKTTHW